MPAMPWVQREVPLPDREYVALATRLSLASFRSLPRFLRGTMLIRRQLGTAPGLVGYSLKTSLPHKTFFTLSVWVDDASLRAFAEGDPHRRVVQGLRPRMKDSQFEFFTASGDALPLSWADALARLSPTKTTRSST
jgi:heme-degrading monooxygenase HmoA